MSSRRAKYIDVARVGRDVAWRYYNHRASLTQAARGRDTHRSAPIRRSGRLKATSGSSGANGWTAGDACFDIPPDFD